MFQALKAHSANVHNANAHNSSIHKSNMHKSTESGANEKTHYVQPAIIECISEENLCHVTFSLDGQITESWAMLAVPAYEPVVGDRVLVTGESADACYIIGVLPSSSPSSSQDDKQANRMLATKTGAIVRVTQKNNQECLQIENNLGQVLFEYRPEQGTGILSMPEGDLALHAPKGNIQLVSGKSVVCSSIAPVVLESASGIDLSVKTEDADATSMRLSKTAFRVKSQGLGLDAQKANIHIDTANYQGRIINGTVERAKWVYQKLENIVDRLLEQTRNVYRQTQELHQTKAGRMRTLVDDDYYLKSDGVDVRAEEIVKIDGKKIHLG